MVTILIDHNIEGQAELLWAAIEAAGWMEVEEIKFVRFNAVGLAYDSPDRAIWRFAQSRQMYLLTSNRNKKGDDALEQTIDEENTATSLPVITVGSVKRLRQHDYREECADRLVEIVFYPQPYLGTGRQFIP